MTARLRCDGRGCDALVGKDEAEQIGWHVVLLYPLREDQNGDSRRLLCRVCSRRVKAVLDA